MLGIHRNKKGIINKQKWIIMIRNNNKIVKIANKGHLK